MATRRTIDVQDGDKEWVELFMEEIRMCCGMIEEAFEENKTLLLSPVMRALIRDRGRKLEAMRQKVINRVCVDNLGEPLSK